MLFKSAIITLVCQYVLVTALPTDHGWHDQIYVQSGQSIQAAINSANPGSSIVVKAGTYAEQVLIAKDDISLAGETGATIVPPSTYSTNACTGIAGDGTNAGICIAGSGLELAAFITEHQKLLSVGTTVKNILVSGFEVSGFDSNVIVVGAENTIIKDCSSTDGTSYGLLADGSINTIFKGNSVKSEDKLSGIAICTDNQHGAEVLHNDVSGYYVGLCIQTSSSEIAFNHVSESCAGAFVDPGVESANVHHNTISALNPACFGDALVTSGLLIYGSINSQVVSNTISGQHTGGAFGAGIVLVDAVEISPDLVASGNHVTDNILFDNDLDIFVNTTGTGNVVTHNQCSTPASLCS